MPRPPRRPPGGWTSTRRDPVRLPRAVERVLDRYLKERFPKATSRRLPVEVAALSDAFTAERGTLPGSYLNQPPVRSAYLAYFHPLQLLRALSALGETVERATARGHFPGTGDGPLRVLDAGAGLGAMTQALLLAAPLPARPLDAVLLDHQKSALADARELTARVAAGAGREPPRIRIAARRLDPFLQEARERGWRYDVILVGGLLNERDGDWRGPVSRLTGLLDGGGLVCVVEPALPEVGRKLMALRDAMSGEVTTLAPCTHDAACPLLALRKDWCFTVRRAEVPRRVASLAAQLGNQSDEVRYALWAFAPSGPEGSAGAGHPVPLRRNGRVVTDPMRDGSVICSDGGRERERLPGALRGDLALRR